MYYLIIYSQDKIIANTVTDMTPGDWFISMVQRFPGHNF